MHSLDHLAIIMDGNGRWAEERGLPRHEGHKAGALAALKMVEAASARGIRYMTLYCFSTENWKRPRKEVGFLMGLFSDIPAHYLDAIDRIGCRILHLGSREGLPQPVLRSIDSLVARTARNSGITVQAAINYGGVDEIVRAARKAAADGSGITEETLRMHLDNPEVPPPDFIIRPGGEKRLSGFMLYLSSYAEIGFYDTLWPDWNPEMMDTVIADYQARNRRFGGL